MNAQGEFKSVAIAGLTPEDFVGGPVLEAGSGRWFGRLTYELSSASVKPVQSLASLRWAGTVAPGCILSAASRPGSSGMGVATVPGVETPGE